MESDVWKEMPEAGFFRYPLSYACPNKVTLMKGKVKVSNGQHYVHVTNFGGMVKGLVTQTRPTEMGRLTRATMAPMAPRII